jgi:predicted dehydrogenase
LLLQASDLPITTSINPGERTHVARISIAVIGAGNMGTQHARVVSEHPDFELSLIVDNDIERAQKLANEYSTTASTSLNDALKANAVVVASSTASHVEIGNFFIENRVPLLIEKPLANGIEDVRKLTDLSAAKSVPLMCGFVERFNPVMATLLGSISEVPNHVMALRHSPSGGSNYGNVIDDLLIHDLDLCLQFPGTERVTEMSAVGDDLRDPSSVDALIAFDSNMRANLSANRTSQRKLRIWFVNVGDTTYEADLMRQTLTSYRHLGHDIDGAFGYRSNTVIDVPYIRHAGEPLTLQLSHFRELVEGKGDLDSERKRCVDVHSLISDLYPHKKLAA